MHRCAWVKAENKKYRDYHDQEWGVPVHDDHKLFEMLILEGAQAGLSWETILKKREGYRKAFFDFDIGKCANLSDEYLVKQRENGEIIRNKLKIFSVRKNAKVAQEIQKAFGSFGAYLWQFVDGKPIQNNFKSISEIPAKTALSVEISKDLKKRGMNFVGSTIIYAFMQAVGMTNDHEISCFRYEALK